MQLEEFRPKRNYVNFLYINPAIRRLTPTNNNYSTKYYCLKFAFLSKGVPVKDELPNQIFSHTARPVRRAP